MNGGDRARAHLVADVVPEGDSWDGHPFLPIAYHQQPGARDRTRRRLRRRYGWWFRLDPARVGIYVGLWRDTLRERRRG